MARNRPSRQQVVQTTSVPAPIGGLNSRDSIAAMPPTDAITMMNWFPTPTTLDVRGGAPDWCTGLGGTVTSILVYNGLANTKLFAVAASTLWDVTVQNTPVATNAVSVNGAFAWSYVNFGTPAGQFLIAVDGNAAGHIYDGVGWSTIFPGAGVVTFTSITASGTTATATTSIAHGLKTGNAIIVSGAVPAAYNGIFNIVVTGTNTFTYTMLTAPGGNATTPGGYTQAYQTSGGTDLSKCNFVSAFKGRLYFIVANTLKIAYFPATQVSGVLSIFDMSSIFKLGGHLVAMESWNIDTVQGPNDYFAFFSNLGEVVVYTGFDPTQSSTWNLSGIFRIGRPASGNRFISKVGSDLYAVTVDGVVPLSKAMLTDRSQGSFQVSSKIENLINNDVVTYSNNSGWQIILHPVGNKIIINVPVVTLTTSYQYVCNTLTGAWTIFNGWNAACFELFGDRLMYGAGNKITWCDVGFSDNATAIITDLKPAFSSFGAPGQNKQFTMARPIFSAGGTLGIAATLNTDFRDAGPKQTLRLPPQANVSFWNVSVWNVAMWSVTGDVNINWQSVAGIGYQASYRMQTISKVQCSLLAIDYGYQMGGIY